MGGPRRAISSWRSSSRRGRFPGEQIQAASCQKPRRRLAPESVSTSDRRGVLASEGHSSASSAGVVVAALRFGSRAKRGGARVRRAASGSAAVSRVRPTTPIQAARECAGRRGSARSPRRAPRRARIACRAPRQAGAAVPHPLRRGSQTISPRRRRRVHGSTSSFSAGKSAGQACASSITTGVSRPARKPRGSERAADSTSTSSRVT